MATGAASWGTCRVYGTWNNQDGSLKPGTYTVTIPNRVVNTTDDVIIPAGTFGSGQLNVTLGSPSLDLQLPGNDDPDNSPVNWGQIQILVKFTDKSKSETYVIDTPTGGEVDLADVVLPDSTPKQQAFLVLGVPGGAAQLSSDGQSVLNSDGDPIVTSGGGGGSSITEATATTLTAGSSATATIDGTTLELGIPQGAKGDKGDQGDPGSDATATTDASQLTTGTLSAARLPATAVQTDDLAAYAKTSVLSDYAKTADLGTAATQDTSAFATAAQGTKADSALQSIDLTNVPAGYTHTVLSETGGWPARPTSRTDVLVRWIDVAALGTDPSDAVTGDSVEAGS